MPLSLYEISIPVFIKNIKTLQKLLDKGVAHASDSSNAVTEEALLESRLISDMYTLTEQIQRISDTSKGAAVRVGKIEPVALADTEKTFPELQARLAKTIEILESVDQKTFDENEDAEVLFGQQKLTGKSYLLNVAIPNFYFHFVTAYDLLRKEGVPVGKVNYLGRGF